MGTKDAEVRLKTFFAVLLDELATRESHHAGKQFAIDRLRARMRKRADLPNPALKVKACADFVALNSSLADFKLNLTGIEIGNASLFITRALERHTKSYDVDDVQNPLSGDVLFDNWRFGPGASNGVLGSHTVEKICQKMTCTARSEKLVRLLRMNNPYFSCFDAANGGGISLVSGSRLEVVPKNEDTMRTIAIEPSGNMAMQLAAGRYLEDALRGIGLDITCQQPKNKALAHSGSITGHLATLDMKSASDMIHPDLVRALMPPIWFQLLDTIRSEECVLDGDRVVLNMISTMGNGFTFPLMTMLIASLIYAYRASKGGPNLFIDWSQTAVFGDDVIVPSGEYAGVCDILERAGFVINTDKSYCEGPFRESCGGDYYEGLDVTPFYAKSLRHTTDIYIVINQVLDWCGKLEIPLPATLYYLKFCVGERPYLVPEWHSPFAGILTAQCKTRYKYLQLQLQKTEYVDLGFTMMLAVGGYIDSRIEPAGLDSKGNKISREIVTYAPRPKFSRVRVKDARLPRGYLDGYDPSKRSEKVSSFVSLLVEAIF